MTNPRSVVDVKGLEEGKIGLYATPVLSIMDWTGKPEDDFDDEKEREGVCVDVIDREKNWVPLCDSVCDIVGDTLEVTVDDDVIDGVFEEVELLDDVREIEPVPEGLDESDFVAEIVALYDWLEEEDIVGLVVRLELIEGDTVEDADSVTN